MLGVLGAPLNHSITPGRCDLAPAAIRKAMYRFSPYDIEHDIDLDVLTVRDYGDLPLSSSTPEDALQPLSHAVREALSENDALVLIGGDNGITRPGVHGLGIPLEKIGLVTLDAHFDLRDSDGGLMNGNPVRALLADGLPGRNIVQIGIQAFANSSAYAGVAREAGITVVTAEEALSEGPSQVLHRALDRLEVDTIYFDLDVDVLDRSFAPGCPGARPGGLAPWQVRQCAFEAGLHPKVRAMDLVEVDPDKDMNDVTSLAAASFLLAFASGLAKRLEKLA